MFTWPLSEVGKITHAPLILFFLIIRPCYNLTFFHRLLAKPKPCPVLRALGARLKFECVIGVNGRVWVKAADITQTILVVNAVRNSEFMSEKQCQDMVEQILAL